jgi:hypothetical protein
MISLRSAIAAYRSPKELARLYAPMKLWLLCNGLENRQSC